MLLTFKAKYDTIIGKEYGIKCHSIFAISLVLLRMFKRKKENGISPIYRI